MVEMVWRASSGETSGGNDGQAQDLDVKRLPRRSHRLQILPAVVAQAQIEPMPGEGLLDGLAMAIELVADGRADEVGAVGVEALPHQQVDMAEIDIAEIDRDLLAIAGFGPQLLNISGHVRPSLYHPDGW